VVLTQPLAEMAEHDFVALTTFRRNGNPVSTPVWIAVDGDALVVTTPATSGKVKRLRRDPRVEMRPCNRRGTVPDGAPLVTGVAEVTAPDDASSRALRTKYGWQYRLITTVEKLVNRRNRERVILRITLG
jgi:PPOX class probable F420-dependent enzyme